MHWTAALEELGHTVDRLQEGETTWGEVIGRCADADVFWWTQTLGLAETMAPNGERRAAVDKLNAMLPTVGAHLDVWWGLAREDQLADGAFFRVRHLFTADGDHDEGWARLGINHRWSPPGVHRPECRPGDPDPKWRSDVAFVGSWRHYGHPEWWPTRRAMLGRVRARYGRRFKCWPRREAVRGTDLNDLYASAKVVVGDQCFADRSTWYLSDRLTETVGRGGFLIYPRVPAATGLLVEGVHCAYYTPGDWGDLCAKIDHYLEHDSERERIRAAGQAWVRDHHTYTNRAATILRQIT